MGIDGLVRAAIGRGPLTPLHDILSWPVALLLLPAARSGRSRDVTYCMRAAIASPVVRFLGIVITLGGVKLVASGVRRKGVDGISGAPLLSALADKEAGGERDRAQLIGGCIMVGGPFGVARITYVRPMSPTNNT